MSARLLAWGGTAYLLRNQLGEWPEFPKSDLEDLALLPRGSGAVAFGVGLAGGAPFIVFRERQSEEDRGGYAYTLLLDPGESVWLAAAWNPARILRVLFEPASGLADALRLRPESFTDVATLEQRLSPLPWDSTTGPVRPGFDDIAHWVGASAFESNVVVIDRQTAGLAARPDIGDLETAIDNLPPCLRCARGWLIGGRRGNADALACNLVLDDRDPSERTQPEEAPPQRGREFVGQLLDAVETLRQRIDQSTEVDRWLGRPLWKWELDVGMVCRRLVLFAGLDERATSDTAERVAQELAAPGPFHDVLSRALLKWARAQAKASRLPPTVSRLMVRRQVSGRGPTGRATDADGLFTESQLDPDALEDEFRALRLTPASPEVDSFDLGNESRLRMWEGVLEHAQPVDLPATLEAAWNNLGPRAQGGVAADQLKKTLASRAFECHGRAARPLADWRTLASRPVWRPILEELLKTEARERLRRRVKDWAFEYVEFGGDRDCTWLRASEPNALAALVEAVLASLRRAAAADASLYASWLIQLSGSPVRLALPLDLKLRVASAVRGAWEPLLLVVRLWNGHPVPSGLKPAADEVRKVLDIELTQLARSTPRLETPPNLNELKMYLQQPLNQHVIAAAQKMMPAHADTATVTEWLGALSGHMSRSDLSAVTMRLWLSGPVDSSSCGFWVGADQIADLVKELLTQPASAGTRFLDQNLMTLARSTPEEAKGRMSPIEQGMLAALRAPDGMTAAGRLLGTSGVLDELARHCSPDGWNSCVELIASQLTGRFEAELADRFNALHQLIESGNDPSPELGTMKLLACLLEPQFQRRRHAVATMALGPNAREFDAMVEHLLKSAAIRTHPVAPNSKARELERPGRQDLERPWWRRWIPWLR